MARHGPMGLVGIGEVGKGGDEEYRLGARDSGARPDEERDVIFMIALPQSRRVDAAARISGDLPDEIGLPARVLNVIVMEMDGAVLLRRVREVYFLAVPVVTGDGAHGHVDRPAAQFMRSSIE